MYATNVSTTNVSLTHVSLANVTLRRFIFFQRRLHQFWFSFSSQIYASSLRVMTMVRNVALFIRGICIPPRCLMIHWITNGGTYHLRIILSVSSYCSSWGRIRIISSVFQQSSLKPFLLRVSSFTSQKFYCHAQCSNKGMYGSFRMVKN